MRLSLALLVLAALPARAQTDDAPRIADTDTLDSVSEYPTPRSTVVGSWSEALSTLDVLARSLDAFPAVPADQKADARTSLALTAASAAGGVIETTRFSLSFDDARREANVTLFESGFGLSNVLGALAVEAARGREDGGEPDWAAHAAALREQVSLVRTALAALGIAPR